ncbi:DUF2169 domain-containing protein [Sulfidibacter corallicola]|uniref:DUF2169 domain-containing protein n=1 Tax=Sulfidibacter corallicola TaxID=2818388 RepID=A0A8A4TIM6_SULCO|nr:DUF2169 domain-containing protein [Sulfidibacter corallicola]QTD49347.1 DUF2169 domain-containing protein [Sulfidibacter corallicola]
MKLVNHTPFAAERTVYQDPEGRDQLLVLLKATFDVGEDGTLGPAEEQPPPRSSDTYRDEVGTSSILWENEMGPAKPATDIVMVGTAQAPGGRAVSQLGVSLKVGALEKTVMVTGERIWEDALTGAKPSAPRFFTQMPLIYELAYGGKDASAERQDHWEREPRNPVGRGFRAKRSAQPIEGTPLPCIEDPSAMVRRISDRPAPAGFGFLARDWQPRLSFAGTYDEAWQTERAPLLPRDFDPRFHNAAHPDLIAPGHLRGVEPVEAIHVSESGHPWRFALPGLRVGARVKIGHVEEQLIPPLDTVIIDADNRQVTQIWRGVHDVHDRLFHVKEIQIETT